MSDEMKAFLRELADLLERHGAAIGASHRGDVEAMIDQEYQEYQDIDFSPNYLRIIADRAE